MIRKIVYIDEEKCTGCSLCIDACHEGALKLIACKARLSSDIYCDGLGDCLPSCPVGAISIIEREADDYSEEAVNQILIEKNETEPLACGCPGSQVRTIKSRTLLPLKNFAVKKSKSQLNQWPYQMKLIPVKAPFFKNAELLIAADCTAFTYANIHQEFMHNKVTLIGCPKLDDFNYAEKLTAILSNNEIKNITILRMEVPCCGSLTQTVKTALINCGQMIPWQVHVISTEGYILE